MLILTRRVGQTINIGDDVEVKVLSINGSQVRIGISAPKEIPVHREEIYERIQKEKSLAAGKEANGNIPPDMGKVPKSIEKPETETTNAPKKRASFKSHNHGGGINLGTAMVAAGLNRGGV